MQLHFDTDTFISQKVTRRKESLMVQDLKKYHSQMETAITNKAVLVIGGAGTIGASYIKAILRFRIRKLVVVDINENGLTELIRDLRSSREYQIPLEMVTYPVNFGDHVFERIFHYHGPFEIVANFAAYKHVRSEKDVFSIESMIENNVLRARKLLELLLQNPPEHFFCVSTDKAANPVNIMGASKKLMEELILAYSDKIPIKTARFANVAFSNGSLLQGFIERLNRKQPFSCPLGIRRFFVSPREAGELCLLTTILGKSGDIFFPKLDDKNDMILCDQVARDLLHNLGLEPKIFTTQEEAIEYASSMKDDNKEYPVYFFNSSTFGEKTFEEFYTLNEQISMNNFINLGVIKNSKKRKIEEIDEILQRLTNLFESGEIAKNTLVNILKEYLPGFEHIETGRGLDSQM